MTPIRDHTHRTTRRIVRGLAAFALVGVALGPATAASAGDLIPGGQDGPVGELVPEIPLPELPLPQLPITPGPAEPDGPPVTQDDDTTGHETRNPTAPSHGSADAAEVEVAEEEVVQSGSSEATVEDDNSTHSSATLLALGGETILGAEADSRGEERASEGDPLAPVCEGSDGALCASLLYADASASEDGPGSRSASGTGLVELCAGGDDPSGQTCSGPVEAGVLQSLGTVERDKDGHTSATSGSQVAGLCLQEDPVTGECVVAASALSSQGSADSRTGEASRSSQVAGLGLMGSEAVTVTDSFGLTIAEDCASPSLLCLFLNQGETYGGAFTGHVQEALHASLLEGALDAVVAQSETRVSRGAADQPNDQPDDGTDDGPDETRGEEAERDRDGDDIAGAQAGSGPDAQAGQVAQGGVLPNTGGVWSGLLALALAGVGAGALMLAWSRRALGHVAGA